MTATHTAIPLSLLLGALAVAGCAVERRAAAPLFPPHRAASVSEQAADRDTLRTASRAAPVDSKAVVQRAAYQAPARAARDTAASAGVIPDELTSLVTIALASNPRLLQMQQEAAAAWERVRYADSLPDPEVGAMAVVPPMHFADGRQTAVVAFRQSIPWLQRLNAREQRACFEAWALDAAWQAERLRTIADVKVAYYRLYVLQHQLRINRENRQLIELLINVATQRVAAQAATEGDVLLGTLELSRLEEQRLGLNERDAALRASINRLLNRPAETPVRAPDELSLPEPTWTLETLRQTAWSRQPDIAAAQLRTQAASWGIRIAELERRPDVTVNLEWMVMQPRKEPGMPAFGGDDSVQIGAMVNVPLWHEKYNAMRDEAVRDSIARQFSLADVQRQYEAMLAELLEQARAASRVAALYNFTMLPQARQTFEADQRAYVGPGTVEFDRVIEDFRTVLTLEEGYHRAMGEWAIALARIEQAIAQDLQQLPGAADPAPPIDTDAQDEPASAPLNAPALLQVSVPAAAPTIQREPVPLSHAGRSPDDRGMFAAGAADFLSGR